MYSTYFGTYQMQEGKINEKHWYRGINDNKIGIWYSGRSWHIGFISSDKETKVSKIIFETQGDCPDSSNVGRKLYDTDTECKFEEDDNLSVGKASHQIINNLLICINIYRRNL